MSLKASLDWFQVGFIDVPLETLMKEILSIQSCYFSERETSQFGYQKIYSHGEIKILARDTLNGFETLIYLSGSSCRRMENILIAQRSSWSSLMEKCLNYSGKFSRLDIALDDQKIYFNLNKVIQKAKKGEIISKFKTCRLMEGITLSNGTSLGKTIYFGSAQSRQMFRFYEKNYEQAQKSNNLSAEEIGPWNRYEIQTRQEAAMNLAFELTHTEQIQYVMLSLLNNYIRITNENLNCSQKSKWPTWRPWQQLINDSVKLSISYQPKETTIDEKFYHMKKQWGPSFRVIHEAFNETGRRVDVTEEMLNSELKPKDIKMIEDYVEAERILRDELMKKHGLTINL